MCMCVCVCVCVYMCVCVCVSVCVCVCTPLWQTGALDSIDVDSVVLRFKLFVYCRVMYQCMQS